MNRVLSEILAELRAIRESVEEIRRTLRGEDDSHADFISARKAAQILGIKTARLRQIVGEYEAAGEKKCARDATGMTPIKYGKLRE